MKTLSGKTAILTGASGGLGSHLVHALAAEGINLLLVAFPGIELPKVQAVAALETVRAEVLVADLRNAAERSRVVSTAIELFGRVNLLINHAGVESSETYHELTASQIAEVLAVNLEAPMMLSCLLIPHFLRPASGHIINISSLAGKSGPGFQEPYAATKAGLVAFTQSLRATYRGSGWTSNAGPFGSRCQMSPLPSPTEQPSGFVTIFSTDRRSSPSRCGTMDRASQPSSCPNCFAKA